MLQSESGSCVGVCSSPYAAGGKFEEHIKYVRVARGAAESKSSFLSALSTFQVPHILINARMTNETFGLHVSVRTWIYEELG